MGGRGTNLDVGRYLSRSKAERTGEYTCIHQEGNIKFLVQNEGKSVSAPVFSNTENRIYVTLNREGKIIEISKYNSNHEKEYSISSGHYNEPYLHEHGPYPSRTKIYKDKMPKEHIALYKKIVKMYNAYNIKAKAKSWRN